MTGLPTGWLTLGLALLWAHIALAPMAQAQVPQELAYGPDPLQRYDLYLPDRADQVPLLVMIHGGGWRAGDKRDLAAWKAKQAYWGPRGYGFVSLNYRLLPQVDVRTQVQDVARALAHIQQNASNWGADPARLVLLGHSAGAHLAALLATDTGLRQRHGLTPWAGTVLIDTEALDLASQLSRPDAALHLLQAFGDSPARWQGLDPSAQLTHAPPGAFLVLCSQGNPSCGAASRFVSRINTLQGTAQLQPVALNHGRLNNSLGVTGPHTDAVDRFLNQLGLP